MKIAKKNFSLIKKLGAYQIIAVLAALLLASLAIMATTFVFDSTESQNNTEHLVLVTEHQKLSQELEQLIQKMRQGEAIEASAIQEKEAAINRLIEIYENGDPQTGLPGFTGNSKALLNDVKLIWQNMQKEVDAIALNQQGNLSLKETARRIRPYPSEIMQISSDITFLLLQKKYPIDTIVHAGQLQVLLQSIVKNTNAILLGGENTANAIELASKDSDRFEQILNDLKSGSTERNIKAVTDKTIYQLLSDLQIKWYEPLQASVNSMLTLAPALYAVENAASNFQAQNAQSLDALNALEQALIAQATTTSNAAYIGIASGVIALILIILIGYVLWKDSQYRLAETAETNRRNQHAILKLLDEMSSLADGDLSSYATVTEDVTGAIADSVNYAIDALRDLVATINRTSVHISDAAQTTQRTAEKLTKASGTQKQEILSATQAIAEMANSMNTVSEEAESSVEVAKNSLDIATKGAHTVQDNIKAMDLVREQIQDTSKRIKRLGESSQEIGDIIGVINEISDRTNILALNAAIQASTAGEAGRGFAVVADEVQRLAERTGDAAKQVEALVKAIQTDTNEAISSMEHTTTGVVKGAQLTETAGGALSEIERVSNQLAGLIQGISLNAQEQSKVASSLANVMQVISDITEQTTAGTQETNDSIGNLAILAEELKESVSDFKLPESEETPVFDEGPIPVEIANGAKKQSNENVVFQIATEK